MGSKQTFDELWETKLIPALNVLKPLKAKDDQARVLGFLVGISILGSGALLSRSVYSIPFLMPLSLGLGFAVYYLSKPKHYREKYKETVIKKLLSLNKFLWEPVFNTARIGYMRTNKQSKREWKHTFEESGLYKHRITSLDVDDVLESKARGTTLKMSEISVFYKKNKGREGKEKREEIFKGMLFDITIDRVFEGATYITMRKDTAYGVGNRGEVPVPSTALEWNDFQNLLKVNSSHPREAREILTPDFMDILYTWWRDHRVKMRIGFKENHLYVSVPMVNMFEPTRYSTLEKHKHDIKLYFDSFAAVENLVIILLGLERLRPLNNIDSDVSKGIKPQILIQD